MIFHLKGIVRNIFIQTLMALLLSLQNTSVAAEKSEPTCRSHFIEIDVLSLFTPIEIKNINTSIITLANILGKTSEHDMQTKETFNEQILKLFLEKKLNPKEISVFKIWFASRLEFYKDSSQNLETFLENNIQDRSILLEEQKKTFDSKIINLRNIFIKYQAHTLEDALINADKEYLSKNKDQADTLKDILFILENYDQLERTEKIFLIIVRYDNFNTTQYFLEHGIAATVKDSYNTTALHFAANYNPNFEIIKLLIQKGADVYAADNDNFTALHYAIENPNLQVLRYFARWNDGVLLDYPNNWGQTALHYARDPKVKIEIYQILIDAGADPFIQDHQRQSAHRQDANDIVFKPKSP